MNSDRVIELLKIYGTCPKCGEKGMKEGKDVLEIDKSSFYRSCSCGFRVNITEYGYE